MAKAVRRRFRELPFHLADISDKPHPRHDSSSDKPSTIVKSPSSTSSEPTSTSPEGVLSQQHTASRISGRPSIFGLGGFRHRCAGLSSDEYDLKYKGDEPGGESGPHARVWMMYNDESSDYDSALMQYLGDSLDVLLVFAGLFSGVVSAFVSQTSQSLGPDYLYINSLMTYELVQLQRAAMIGFTADDVFRVESPLNPKTPFTPPSGAAWANGLWFTSLALSLVTALFAVLAKQWIHHYTTLSSGNAKDKARLRQSRFDGLIQWHVPLVISLLPMLLHISLAIFFCGLVVFLFNNERLVGFIVAGIGGMAYLAYMVSIMLPVFYHQCPYRTPLTSTCYILLRKLVQAYVWSRLGDYGVLSDATRCLRASSLQKRELEKVRESGDELDLRALLWQFVNSSSQIVHRIVIEGISGLPSRIPQDLIQSVFKDSYDDIWKEQQTLLNNSLRLLADNNIQQHSTDDKHVERLLRFQNIMDKSEAKAKFVVVPAEWRRYDPRYRLSVGELRLVATVACSKMYEHPRKPALYQSFLCFMPWMVQTTGFTLPLTMWIKLFKSAILKGEMPCTTEVHNSAFEGFGAAVLSALAVSSNFSEEGETSEEPFDETVRGLTFNEALKHGLFDVLRKYLLETHAPFNVYGQSESISPTIQMLAAMVKCVLQTRKLSPVYSRPQPRSTQSTASPSHPGYRRIDGEILPMVSGISCGFGSCSSCSTCCKPTEEATEEDERQLYCNSCMSTIFQALQVLHSIITSPSDILTLEDREVLVDILCQIAESFSGPYWLPLLEKPGLTVLEPDSEIVQIDRIRMRVCISFAYMINDEDRTWGISSGRFLKLMTMVFDPDILSPSNTKWYLEAYGMDGYIQCFQSICLSLGNRWGMNGMDIPTYDAFIELDVLHLALESCKLWHVWLQPVSCFVLGLHHPSALLPDMRAQRQKYIDYVYRPRNLFTNMVLIAAPFALRIYDSDLMQRQIMRLWKLQPHNDVAWRRCIKKLAAFGDKLNPMERTNFFVEPLGKTAIRPYSKNEISNAKATIKAAIMVMQECQNIDPDTYTIAIWSELKGHSADDTKSTDISTTISSSDTLINSDRKKDVSWWLSMMASWKKCVKWAGSWRYAEVLGNDHTKSASIEERKIGD